MGSSALGSEICSPQQQAASKTDSEVLGARKWNDLLTRLKLYNKIMDNQVSLTQASKEKQIVTRKRRTYSAAGDETTRL